jgi:predicted ATPase/DNA-binding SARP family transcriptional activator/class 3 adenylate cyclase
VADLPPRPDTFLVTDIVGSTGLWDRAEKEMSAAVADHDRILRVLVSRHGGRIVKGSGDGIMAVFERAEMALEAAVAIQAAFRVASWEQIGALHVRIALNSGEAEPRDGDYFGPTVNHLSRLVKATNGEQILASKATIELAESRLPVGICARPAGALELRDLLEPLLVFAVVPSDDTAVAPLAVPARGEKGSARSTIGQAVGVAPPPSLPTSSTRTRRAGGSRIGLRVRLLGGFHIERGGQTLTFAGSGARSGLKLFKCLLSRSSRRLPREQAYELLWPDSSPDAVRTTFRTNLVRLRAVLEPDVPPEESLIVTDRDTVAIRPNADLWVDADEFERLVREARRAPLSDDLLEEADQLYGGDFSPDDPYEDWAVQRREELRRRWTELQLKLSHSRERRGDVDGAISALQRLLDREHCDEQAARELMLLLARHGRRAAAEHVYKQLTVALRTELGDGDETVEPDPETERVRHAIFAGDVPGAPLSILPLLGGLSQARRDMLPAETTVLIGREAEVRAARDRLVRDDVRLLTLTGIGGSGKTRLARRIADEVKAQFAAGVYYVDLGAVSEDHHVIPSVAQELGVREVGERSLADCVHDAIGRQQVLLLLDNFEQVLGAAHAVSALLAACPNLTVLATSRAALRIRGERIFEVEPLALPEPPPMRTLPPSAVAEIAQSPAVRLFVERVQDVRRSFALTGENAATVVEICRRLDGLPLAIELAAARARMYSPSALLAALSRRFDFLTGGPRDVPSRHQTMRDAVLWSYELLAEPERDLFCRLAIFAGGCTIDAVEQVCRPSEDRHLDPAAGVRSLVDASLLRVENRDDGEPRFNMLETVRELGLEHLAASGRRAELERRRAAYYLRLAERAEVELEGSTPPSWLERLEAEHDNVRATLGWTVTRGELETGFRLASSIWQLWDRHGHASDGRAWLEAALDQEAALPALSKVPAPVRAKALVAAGELACAMGDIPRAMLRCEEGLAIYEKLGDRAGRAKSLHILGWWRAYAAETDDDYHQAREYQEACQTLQRQLGNERGVAKAQHELGEIARYLREFETARTCLREALEMRRRLDDIPGVGWSLHCLAWTDYDQRDLDGSRRLDRAMWLAGQALATWERLGDEAGIATTRSLVARIAWRQGDAERAVRELLVSLLLWSKLQHPVSLGYDLQVLAGLAIERAADSGGAECAARLLAMASTVRSHKSPPLHRRRELDDLELQVRARLDEDAFEAAWDEGRATPADGIAPAAHAILTRWHAVGALAAR